MMQIEVERFIDWVGMRSPQARTWRDYRCDLALFSSVMGQRNVEEIRPRDMDDFVNFQVGEGFKPTTVNRRLAAVSSFYAFLIRGGRQIVCPVLPKRHYLREPQRLPRPVNEQELRKFFGAIEDVRDRAMFTLMLRCGLRIGEVSALQMPDLFLVNMLLLVADENFNNDILRGLLRRNSSLDIVRIQDVGLTQTPDPEVLEWAAQSNLADTRPEHNYKIRLSTCGGG